MKKTAIIIMIFLLCGLLIKDLFSKQFDKKINKIVYILESDKRKPFEKEMIVYNLINSLKNNYSEEVIEKKIEERLKTGEGYYNLGLYYNELGMDHKKAIKYYKKACDLGYGKGCYSLGEIYYYGPEASKGIKYYIKEGIKYYKKACNLGDKKGCYWLGNLYYSGYRDIVSKDYKKVIKYYKKACDLGYKKGCNDLGDLYLSGDIVSKDYKKAIKYYKKACELGDDMDCLILKHSFKKKK